PPDAITGPTSSPRKKFGSGIVSTVTGAPNGPPELTTRSTLVTPMSAAKLESWRSSQATWTSPPFSAIVGSATVWSGSVDSLKLTWAITPPGPDPASRVIALPPAARWAAWIVVVSMLFAKTSVWTATNTSPPRIVTLAVSPKPPKGSGLASAKVP